MHSVHSTIHSWSLGESKIFSSWGCHSTRRFFSFLFPQKINQLKIFSLFFPFQLIHCSQMMNKILMWSGCARCSLMKTRRLMKILLTGWRNFQYNSSQLLVTWKSCPKKISGLMESLEPLSVRQCIILKTISPKDLLEQIVSLSLSGILHAFTQVHQQHIQTKPSPQKKIKSKMEWFQNQLHWNKQLNLFDVQSNHHGLDANQNPWVQQWNLRIYMRVCGHVCFICWTCSSTCHISLMAKTWLWKSDRATCRMPWIVTWTHWKNVNVLEGLMSGGGSEQLFNTWFKSISHCDWLSIIKLIYIILKRERERVYTKWSEVKTQSHKEPKRRILSSEVLITKVCACVSCLDF